MHRWTIRAALALIVVLVLFEGLRSKTHEPLGKAGQTKAILHSLQTALATLAQDTSFHPTSIDDLNVLVANPGNIPGWDGPYYRKAPPTTDAWGRAWAINTVNRCRKHPESIAIYSLGENGIDECMQGDDIL